MSKAIIPFILIPAVLVLTAIFQAVLNKSFDYECENCGKKFSVPPFISVLTPHIMGRKLVKCPYCGKRTWAKRVRKD